ncbi:hypothetical protein [Thermomonas sp. HDW16]|uniref:hypothetical protein n=1 Tax=Thermomonas sp. HDW16 TaxID=2714945 RepID=UPI00140D8557|nr:hypothetical protein [Thermomonas sp. HDW16]QIL21110.1 hypothetical protein G7079_10425 [Thermomonas sp. HDW16]
MNMKLHHVAVLGSLLFVAGNLHAASPDASVGKKLDATGLKYEVDGDGDYKLLFAVDGGRSQIVWVRTPTEALGGMRIREVLSIGGKMSKPQTEEELTAQAVLTSGAMLKSGNQKLGGWVLKTSGDDSVFYYVAQVPADISAEDLQAVTQVVAKSADAFEVVAETMLETSKKDTY